MAVRALLWEVDPAMPKGVVCRVCSHYCRIPENETGRCRTRVNKAGVLFSLTSDQAAVSNLDPVEKKPLYHFMPGTSTFSLGTRGCNMRCLFCQNHSLSQVEISTSGSFSESLSGQRVSGIAALAIQSGAASVSFTYNEPTVGFELIAGVAPRALEAGLANVLVSNAYASKECLTRLKPLIQAANFDLKAFDDNFYRDVCGARLVPVLRTLAQAVAFGWHVEITTLLIPGANDSDAEVKALARFIKEDLGEDVPWHISRFRPLFQFKKAPPTPIKSLERARAIGLAEGLRFVYIGNVPGHDAENTYCPGCGEIVVRRSGYQTAASFSHICGRCGETVPIVRRRRGEV